MKKVMTRREELREAAQRSLEKQRKLRIQFYKKNPQLINLKKEDDTIISKRTY